MRVFFYFISFCRRIRNQWASKFSQAGDMVSKVRIFCRLSLLFISNEGNKDLVVVKPLPFRTYFVVRCVVAEPPWQMEFGWWGDERCGKYA